MSSSSDDSDSSHEEPSSSSNESSQDLEKLESVFRSDKSTDQSTKSNLGSHNSSASQSNSILSGSPSACSSKPSKTSQAHIQPASEVNIAVTSANQPGSSPSACSSRQSKTSQAHIQPAPEGNIAGTSAKQPGSSADGIQDDDYWDDDLDMFDGPVRKPRLPRLTQHNLQEANSGLVHSADNKKGNKNSEGKRNSKLDFTRFMYQKVVIKLNGRRQLRGQMQGCDQYNNIVITEGQEKINGKVLNIEYALVRGTSITGIESIAEPLVKEM